MGTVNFNKFTYIIISVMLPIYRFAPVSTEKVLFVPIFFSNRSPRRFSRKGTLNALDGRVYALSIIFASLLSKCGLIADSYFGLILVFEIGVIVTNLIWELIVYIMPTNYDGIGLSGEEGYFAANSTVWLGKWRTEQYLEAVDALEPPKIATPH